jgi:hypothetical protein
VSRPRRKVPPGQRRSGPDVLREVLGPLDGARIPGGCGVCDAWQTVRPIEAGVWVITVHHDDSCPVLARMRPEAGGAS